MAFKIDASISDMSYISSVGVGSPAWPTGGLESVFAWDLLALPAFLYRGGNLEKLRSFGPHRVVEAWKAQLVV